MEDYIKNNIEEFQQDGKNFIYFNIAGLSDNDQFEHYAAAAREIIKKYPPKSVYVITSRMMFFDTRTKDICSEWIVFNKPYVIASALVGINGITRMVAKSIYKQAERDFAPPFIGRDEAVAWLLTQS
ncbi:MAG: hypothetical protein LBB74_04645 [Chitinispirillales bacterium]|jgi:hypothetical protein|nr:hypothetical protein [Chitinispirillales bacterium]